MNHEPAPRGRSLQAPNPIVIPDPFDAGVYYATFLQFLTEGFVEAKFRRVEMISVDGEGRTEITFNQPITVSLHQRIVQNVKMSTVGLWGRSVRSSTDHARKKLT